MENHMEKFNIDVVISTFKSINLQMEPAEEVMEVAQKLSVAYDTTVHVVMFARSRRTYEKGVMIQSSPDLDKFYTNSSEQDKWDWSCFGRVTT